MGQEAAVNVFPALEGNSPSAALLLQSGSDAPLPHRWIFENDEIRQSRASLGSACLPSDGCGTRRLVFFPVMGAPLPNQAPAGIPLLPPQLSSVGRAGVRSP